MALAAIVASVAHAQEAPQDAPYRDRIIAAESLAPLPPDDEEPVDAGGLPRAYHLEAVAARTERGDETFNEEGIAAGGFWETPAWGSFSLDATLFHSNRDRFEQDSGWGGAATLWQRNLYVDGGWHLDNGLGAINTPSLGLQRGQYRFFLPTVPFAGVSSQATQSASGVTFYGAVGRAGLYNGTRVVGFDLADGYVASAGAQWQWAPGWTGAASYLGTHGRIEPDDTGEATFVDDETHAVHVATGWEGERDTVQFNALASDAEEGRAQGAWIDASARRGRYRHNYGLFSLDPGLAWGALPINNDIRGGYYRIAYQFARWSWNLGLDDIRSISGEGFDGQYGTGFARYQASSTFGYGGSLSMRHTPENTYAAQLFADKSMRWGQTRLQFDLAEGGDGGGDSWLASVDQAFPMRGGARLSASLAYGELSYDGEPATATTTVALYGGRDLTDTLSIDGTARWTHGDGPSATRGVDFNIGLNWRIRPRWSLAAAFYQSQGSQRSPFILDPLVTDTPFISLPRDRSVFLTLRYDRQAGQPLAVIGGAPGAAVGSVAGSLFLDDNNDGVRAASELPAANVTIVLDGRYSVRTDSNGQFEFPRVAVGPHRVAVLPDNLPLPWFVEDAAAQRTIEVRVRQTTRLDIPAGRQR
ncbi:carboxypeptidase-like regulatory domain-containing protein [Luteimonas sp. SX5]|uniref:Carboxypeptidase-like regulatory domain-containing protein n=1 Tax=Luteimonas galliterrae TaxID=2940486 RepID=A0ABT0MJC1_9GAMM|nr:carboxypeptidase-like regulatory domain-containing protein [Luteimonas galliterrae]MCL1634977.1 carboxypeptidase-like regulatory domain-containing protein [Luteimonas galliterrae]